MAKQLADGPLLRSQLGDYTDEEKALKRLCRAVVLRSMIDVLHYELKGTIPAMTSAGKVEKERVCREAREFLFSREGGLWCRGAVIPVKEMYKIMSVTDRAEKANLLVLLDSAYRAVSTEGLR